jgi:ACS family hexuronate transporter-like MFS transporter
VSEARNHDTAEARVRISPDHSDGIAGDRAQRLAWFVMCLLFLGSVVNYLDRAVLGVLMPEIRRDLALTNTGYAMAVNAFLVTYTVTYIVGGRVADRLGSRRTFTVTLLWWSLAAMAHSIVRGVGSLALCRALLGIGEGGYYPAAIRGAAEWFEPRKRAKAVGLILSAISVGTLSTPPVVAWITIQSNWRVAFLVTGAAGLLLLPPWLALHRAIHREFGLADPAPGSALEPKEATAAGPSLRVALRSRRYWCLLSGRACADSAWYFYLLWMPGYFQDERHLSLAAVGSLLWIPFLAAGLGALFGAWAGTALIAHGWELGRSRRTMLVLSSLAAGAGALAYLAPGYVSALAIISFALFGHTSFSSNMHTAITEAAPARHVAVLYGMTGAAGTLGGVAMQSAVGRIVDAGGYGGAFLLTAVLYLVSIVCVMGAGSLSLRAGD